MHPGAGNRDGTLLNALLHHAPALAALPRAGIVHRLDKDTSGLMVVAKTPAAQTDLVRQLQARTVTRQYLALARGDLARSVTVDAPIGRHPVQRTSMAVVASGKPARTHVDVVERFGATTLVRCRLETGRTHQIRVHLASIGHPLVGDPVYGGRAAAFREACAAFARQALHAERLALVHPVTRRERAWTSPLPADFATLLAAIDAATADAGAHAMSLAQRFAARARLDRADVGRALRTCTAFVTTRNGGASRAATTLDLGPAHLSSLDDARREAIVANRATVGAFLPSPPVWLEQVHGTRGRVGRCAQCRSGALPPPIADAAVTRLPDVPLGSARRRLPAGAARRRRRDRRRRCACGMARACRRRTRSDGCSDGRRPRIAASRGSVPRSARARSRWATTCARRSAAATPGRSRASSGARRQVARRSAGARAPAARRGGVTRVAVAITARGATRRASSRTGATRQPQRMAAIVWRSAPRRRRRYNAASFIGRAMTPGPTAL